MRVFLTGATGFIGKRLVQRLLEGNRRLRLFVRRPPLPLSFFAKISYSLYLIHVPIGLRVLRWLGQKRDGDDPRARWRRGRRGLTPGISHAAG